MKAKQTENPDKHGQRQAVLWGRFSSDKQEDGDSKASQNRYNWECAKRNNIDVIGEHFDEGVSVKDGVTQKFKDILKTLPKGVGIICRDLDRINRGHSIDAQYYLKHDIIEKGHFVITSTDNIEYNEDTIKQASTLIIGGMKTTIAYGENEKRIRGINDAIASSLKLAREGKPAPLGAWLPSHLKYNFETKKYDDKKDKQGNRIADITKRIFDEYANGKGTSSIVNGLNDDNIPTFHSKKAGQWTKSSVSQLLQYEGVIGVLTIRGERIPKAVPPAISEDLFWKVQTLIKQHTGRHGNYNSGNVNNVFRGLCSCVHCGMSIKAFPKKKSYSIGCMGYREKRKDENGNRCPAKHQVPWDEMERELIKWFVPQAKDALLGKDDSKTLIDGLLAKQNAVQTKLQNDMPLLDDPRMPRDMIIERLARLQKERVDIENEIKARKAEHSSKASMPDSINELETLIDDACSGNQQSRKRIATLASSIVKDVQIDIANRDFPSFKVILIDGQVLHWEYDIIMYATPSAMGRDKQGRLRHPKGKVLIGGYNRQTKDNAGKDISIITTAIKAKK